MKPITTFLTLSLLPFFAWAQLGTIDPTFTIGTGAGGGLTQKRIETVVQQPDGKLLLGGWFTDFNEIPNNRIVRLHPNGTVDATFVVGTGFEGVSSYVNDIALQPDGKIVVGGNFLNYNEVTRHRIVRLHPNGALDESFNPGTGFNSDVNSIAIQPDGKIVVGGIFTFFDWLNNGGVPRQGVARLNSDGSLDTSFDAGIGFTSEVGQTNVRTILVQPDGKVICAGIFNHYKGTIRALIARLNQDASLDTTFDAGPNFSFMFGSHGAAMKTVLLPDGKIITAGTFRHIGADSKAIVKLNADGSHDPSLAIDLGNISALTVQSDGKLLIGSVPFTLKRYLSTGAEDPSFPTITFNNWIRHCMVQEDGNIVIGGWFSYNPSGLMRLIGDTPLSLEDYSATLDAVMYPNPSSHLVTIALDDAVFEGQVQIQVLDMQGRRVKQFESNDSSTTVPVNDLPKGTYLVQINTTASQIVKKLVVH